MGLSIPTYASLIQSNLNAKSYQGHNFNGSQLPTFALAVATGVITTSLSLKGIINSPSGTGSSSGVGITFSGTNISADIRTAAIGLFGQEGPALKDFCDAIGNATQTHFAQAALSSDTNGTAKFPAFSGAITTMATAIQNAAPAFVGSQWPNFALAIATGICQEIGSNGTGSLSGALGSGAGGGVVNIS